MLFAASGETIDEIGKSAVNLIQSEACCGGDVILFRPERQVEARYMGYATDCRSAAAQKATMGRGTTVMHIYGGQLKYLTLPLPPLPEQIAITHFLDYTDRRIQRYIRAKQKLITLLEEQKQAIIHQA
ncbi:MAG: restriction endonuclease subunit S, partial [Truepera sp.]|nr:restriction endonuclease subunit S [Truepera sp.]